jgi:hypothetical protein
MRTVPRFMLPVLLLGVVASSARAQGMPTSQPGVLTIIVEELKPGVAADHEANESGWPKAFAKANYPYYYLALEAITGTPEIWFALPYQSWTAEGESIKQMRGDAALSTETDRLAKADGPFLAGSRTFQAIARPDLSYGQFPDLAMVRFYEVTTFRVRPGHDQGWEAAAKVYMENAKRLVPGMSYRVYQVTGGMPGGTFLIFSTANSYGEFDKQMAESNGMWAKVSAQDMTALQQTMANDVLSVITHRYRVSPTMSYVSAEAKAKDPSFWK